MKTPEETSGLAATIADDAANEIHGWVRRADSEDYPENMSGLAYELQSFTAIITRRIAPLVEEIDRLKANIGCARNQGTTQFCAEAVDAHKRIAELEAQLKDFRLACGTADLGKWENWLDRAQAENAQLKDRVAELERDKARLDWLLDRDNNIGEICLPRRCVEENLTDGRAAIDAAMEGGK